MLEASSVREGIVWMDDGTITSFSGREIFTTRGARPSTLSRLTVYCADGTTRRVLGYTQTRRSSPLIWHLLGNGFWTGVPIVSDPTGKYDLEDLRSKIRKAVRRGLQTKEERQEFDRKLAEAASFEELFLLVPSLSSGLQGRDAYG